VSEIVDPEGVVVERVDVGGLTLSVAQAGPAEGPPVLLLHGFPDSHLLWRHQVAALAEAGHRVVAPDLRGYGESDRPTEVAAYAMRRLVGDVAGLLSALGVGRTAVVGHDWGAGLAWATAMSLPDRVERLAVVSVGHPGASPAAGVEQRRASWYMLWFLFPGVAEAVLPADDWAYFRQWGWGGAAIGTDPDCDRQVADLSRPGALEAALAWYRTNIDPTRFVGAAPRGSAPPVGCPTMGVWSSGDPFLTEAQMTGSEGFVTGPWRYERLEGVDHWVPVHAPDRLDELLLDFLG
jgi:pimeloyl-ACP methyl ester carboxylesterase